MCLDNNETTFYTVYNQIKLQLKRGVTSEMSFIERTAENGVSCISDLFVAVLGFGR